MEQGADAIKHAILYEILLLCKDSGSCSCDLHETFGIHEISGDALESIVSSLQNDGIVTYKKDYNANELTIRLMPFKNMESIVSLEEKNTKLEQEIKQYKHAIETQLGFDINENKKKTEDLIAIVTDMTRMAHAGDDSTLKPFAEKLDEYLGHLEKIKDLHEKYDSIYGYILQPMVKSISKSATKGTWVTVAVAVISLLLTALLK